MPAGYFPTPLGNRTTTRQPATNTRTTCQSAPSFQMRNKAGAIRRSDRRPDARSRIPETSHWDTIPGSSNAIPWKGNGARSQQELARVQKNMPESCTTTTAGRKRLFSNLKRLMQNSYKSKWLTIFAGKKIRPIITFRSEHRQDRC